MLRERRSGFERRDSRQRTPLAAAIDSSLLHLRDNPLVLAEVLVLANLLSLLDLTLTLILLRQGASEANVVMSYFFAAGTAQAAIFKCGVVGAASLAIWGLRRRRPALSAALVFVAVYGAVVIYELIGLARLI